MHPEDPDIHDLPSKRIQRRVPSIGFWPSMDVATQVVPSIQDQSSLAWLTMLACGAASMRMSSWSRSAFSHPAVVRIAVARMVEVRAVTVVAMRCWIRIFNGTAVDYGIGWLTESIPEPWARVSRVTR